MGALYEKAQGPDLRLVHPSTSALLLTALLASLSYSASELVCPSCMLGEICLQLWAPMTGGSFSEALNSQIHARPAGGAGISPRVGLWQSGAPQGRVCVPAPVGAPRPCRKGLLTSSSARVWSGLRLGSWSCRVRAAALVGAVSHSPWQLGHRDALARGLHSVVLAFCGRASAARGCLVLVRWAAIVGPDLGSS